MGRNTAEDDVIEEQLTHQKHERDPYKSVFEESLKNPNVTPRPYENNRFGASHGSTGRADSEQGGSANPALGAADTYVPHQGKSANLTDYDSSGRLFGSISGRTSPSDPLKDDL